ncbi:MAG TPA: molybdopterin-dependent oxidoreductase [Terriglobia bacterium]|nr:molybdopterin-dependent oxidoreductase [Terriglobia bacterium]
MRRREFIALAGGAFWLRRLNADSAVASQNPLVRQYNLESLQGEYTPADEFYVRNHNAVPRNLGSLALRIEGDVEKPQALTAADLGRLPVQSLAAVLECAGNGTGPYQLAGNALWEGWPLEEVLKLARPRPSAAYLHLEGRDGFVRSVPRARALEEALLVTRMNQQPLLPEHGGPWRVVFPGYYGMDSVKWVERIAVSDSPLQPAPNDYLALRKNASGAVETLPLPGIQLKSVFIYPAVGAVLRTGRVDARGLVWSNGEKVMAVEVSSDAGKTWHVARLDSATSKYAWRFWQMQLDLTERGLVELACKAIDALGNQQPAERPADRADGYADNQIERIRVMVT